MCTKIIIFFGNQISDMIFYYCLHVGRAYFQSYNLLDEVVIYEKPFIALAFSDLDISEPYDFIETHSGHGMPVKEYQYCCTGKQWWLQVDEVGSWKMKKGLFSENLNHLITYDYVSLIILNLVNCICLNSQYKSRMKDI